MHKLHLGSPADPCLAFVLHFALLELTVRILQLIIGALISPRASIIRE